MTKEINLHPPIHKELTGEDILRMKVNFFSDQLFHYLFLLEREVKGNEKAMKIINELYEKMNCDTAEEFLNNFAYNEFVHQAIIDGASEMHMGDCTAVASSCVRCWADHLFEFPDTVTWGKHEGYEALSRMNSERVS